MDPAEEVAAGQLSALLSALQFPSSDPASAVPLLRDCVRLLPDLKYARDVAALTRMIMLSPSIWPDDSQILTQATAHPVGLFVHDAFRTVLRVRANSKAVVSHPSAKDDTTLFVNAMIAGLATCANVPSHCVCALAGIMSASPVAGAMRETQSAFVEALNNISHNAPAIDDPVSFSISATVAYSITSQSFKAKIHVSPSLLSILANVLFAPEMHADVKPYAGPLALFTGELYRFMATSSDLNLSLIPLSIIFESSVRFRRVEAAKETAFAMVSVLTGLADGIQSRASRKWHMFAGPDALEVDISKQIILILRNLSTTVYRMSVDGFAAQSYLHSAAVGILLSSGYPPVDDLVKDLQTTDADAELLFELNTAEKILLSSPASSPLPSSVLAQIVKPAQKIIAATTKPSGSSISRGIYEAAHAVFLASLFIPALAIDNVRYVHSTYLPSVLVLYESNIISDKQLTAVVRSLSSAFTPGSGILCSAAPTFGEDVLIPAIRGAIKGPKTQFLIGIYVDAVLACIPPERVEFWLSRVEQTRPVIAERIKLGEIPSVCTEGVVRWWFSTAEEGDMVNSRL
ncbi:hypothetical protein BZA70DRAFT_277478 [Myxozyma melibiosi]|uniref:Uncharacterized protein n=1 Tax=Myxozyma melibiosi TaxID=54550 RepID=A0ABR1F7W4_9ASCO